MNFSAGYAVDTKGDLRPSSHNDQSPIPAEKLSCRAGATEKSVHVQPDVRPAKLFRLLLTTV
jgi:hypothetical protein